jgi:hypothetical protein
MVDLIVFFIFYFPFYYKVANYQNSKFNKIRFYGGFPAKKHLSNEQSKSVSRGELQNQRFLRAAISARISIVNRSFRIGYFKRIKQKAPFNESAEQGIPCPYPNRTTLPNCPRVFSRVTIR